MDNGLVPEPSHHQGQDDSSFIKTHTDIFDTSGRNIQLFSFIRIIFKLLSVIFMLYWTRERWVNP